MTARANTRVWIAVAACALLCGPPSSTEAQPGANLYRIGVLDLVGTPSNEENLSAFRQGLRELGYVEGQNLLIEYRSADGRAERFPDLATELVQLKVDVIVTTGTSAALGAKHVTDTIPIVMASSGDPVFAGLVASLALPGGNVTGFHTRVPPGFAGKRLQLLKEVMPGLSRVGVLVDPGDVYSGLMMRDIEKVAHAIGVQLRPVEARRPGDFERTFEAVLLDRVDALITVEGILTIADLTRIVDFAAMSRLPAIYGRDLFRRSATYVHRILKGAKPADLRVEPPTKFELVINLKTAKALGLTIPPSLLLRADYVIQ